jgi:hypothetical protein
MGLMITYVKIESNNYRVFIRNWETTLTLEVLSWLHENAGNMAPKVGRLVDPSTAPNYGWAISDINLTSYEFFAFKDSKVAAMFKLIWG